MSDFVLYSENLSVGYDGKTVVSDIEIGVNRGQILTLIGPNGAGKTTILKSLIAQLKPVAGTVWLSEIPSEDYRQDKIYVNEDITREQRSEQDTSCKLRRKMEQKQGDSVERKSREKAIRKLSDIPPQELARRMSVVLTERLHTEMMTCEDVVAMGRYPYTGRMGILSEEDRRIVRETMELVSVADLAEQNFQKLSDGQRQRVMLARALCQEPEILVLDEPTSFLDIRYKLEFLTILQKMVRERNIAVIMSLHELDLAERISDQIVCVKADHIDRIGSPEEIFQPGYIRSLYQLSAGSYDERIGTPELNRIEGEPEVFVIAGAGTGIPTFRRLQREGIPFAAGILWENDLDYPVAHALAAEVVSIPAFSPVTEQELNHAKELIRQCGRVICTLEVEAVSNHLPWLKELLDFAEENQLESSAG